MNDSDPLLNSLKKSEEKRLFPLKKNLTPLTPEEMQEQLDESNKNKYFTSLPHIIEYHHNRSKKPENPNLNNAEENAEIDELFDKIDNNEDEKDEIKEEFDKVDNNNPLPPKNTPYTRLRRAKSTSPLTQKSTSPLTQKSTSPLTQKSTSPLTPQKPPFRFKGGKRKTKKSRRKGRKRTKTYKKKKYLNLRKRN